VISWFHAFAFECKLYRYVADLLADLDDMGLLDEGDPEVLAAARDALAEKAKASAA
jgi:hypothetical protein